MKEKDIVQTIKNVYKSFKKDEKYYKERGKDKLSKVYSDQAVGIMVLMEILNIDEEVEV